MRDGEEGGRGRGVKKGEGGGKVGLAQLKAGPRLDGVKELLLQHRGILRTNTIISMGIQAMFFNS